MKTLLVVAVIVALFYIFRNRMGCGCDSAGNCGCQTPDGTSTVIAANTPEAITGSVATYSLEGGSVRGQGSGNLSTPPPCSNSASLPRPIPILAPVIPRQEIASIGSSSPYQFTITGSGGGARTSSFF